MSKQGIIGRVTQLARADISAIIDGAAEPRRVVDQLRRVYTTTVAAAEDAIAQLSANLRIAEHDQQEDARAAARWGEEAEGVSQKADELRATGAALEADRFDKLAMVALERQLLAENDVETSQHTAAAQRESVARLSDGLGQLTVKLAELRHADEAMTAQSREPASGRSQAHQQQQRRQPTTDADVMDPASEIGRFEDAVRREEARARGAEPLSASALDARFLRLGAPEHKPDIDERLQALKAGRAMATAKAKIQALEHDQLLR